jgi:hypothetical protein
MHVMTSVKQCARASYVEIYWFLSISTTDVTTCDATGAFCALVWPQRKKVELRIFRYQITVSGREDKATYTLNKRTGICFFVYLMMMPLPYSFNSIIWEYHYDELWHIRRLGKTVRLNGL